MDREIQALVNQMDFASIPKEDEESSTGETVKRRSTRIKHGTAQDSDSDSTIDPKNLAVQGNKSENRNSFEYEKDQMSFPTYDIKRPVGQLLSPNQKPESKSL